MKIKNEKLILFIIATLVTFYGIGSYLIKGTKALDEVPVNPAFDDMNFYKCVVTNYNRDNWTEYDYLTYSLSDSQLSTISSLYCNGRQQITSAKGIEKLINVDYIDFSSNNLTELNVSNNKKLTKLVVVSNQLTALDVSGATLLEVLWATNNQLTILDVSNNVELTNLDVSGNQLSSLDISNNKELIELRAYNNNLAELNVDNNLKLSVLYLSFNTSDEGNLLTELNISNNIDLTKLWIDYNQLSSLDISNNKNLTQLRVSSNQLSTLDVSGAISLEELNVSNNQLTKLDISKNIALTSLNASNNQLTELDVSNNLELLSLYVNNNQLTELDVSKNVGLTKLNVSNNKLTELDVSKNTELTDLYITNNQLTELDVSKNTNLTIDIIYTIHSNPYGNKYYVYKGDEIIIDNSIKLPSSLGLSDPVWRSSDTNIATVDNNRLVTTINAGSVKIIGTRPSRYTITNIVNVIEITSDDYVINNNDDYIYIGTDSSVVKSKIDIPEDITLEIDEVNNKLQVKYNDNVLKEFKIINIDLGIYKTLNKFITLTEDVDYSDFVDNIETSADDITYRIFNGEEELVDGNISNGMELKIYYNDYEIYSYTIVNEYFELDDSLNVDEDNMVIGNIRLGTTINDIKSGIDTNVEFSILDKNDNVIENGLDKLKTGDKIKVILSSGEVIYKVSVNGDVTGDGEITSEDVVKIFKHTINRNIISDREYLEAADVNKDQNININDIIRLAKYIVNNINIF